MHSKKKDPFQEPNKRGPLLRIQTAVPTLGATVIDHPRAPAVCWVGLKIENRGQRQRLICSFGIHCSNTRTDTSCYGARFDHLVASDVRSGGHAAVAVTAGCM